MNILELNNRFQQQREDFQFIKNCSQASNSTDTSKQSSSSSGKSNKSSEQRHETAHFQNQIGQQGLMSEEKEPEFSVDIGKFLEKRKIVMTWLQQYGQQLKLTRSTVGTAQFYADLYFHNNPYIRENVKMTLACLLVLASKQSDYKILYTNHIAFICQLDENKMNETQLQCCQKLDFNLCVDSLPVLIDRIIYKIKISSGYDLYQEQEQSFVKLCTIHRVAERMFVDHYEWNANEKDLWYIVMVVLKDQMESGKNQKLIQLINQMNGVESQNFFEQTLNEQKIKIRKLIQTYIIEYSKNRQNGLRQLFQNRKESKKYVNYQQFAIIYRL